MSIISKKIDSYMTALLLELLIVVTMLFISKSDSSQMMIFIMLGITIFNIIVTYIGGIVIGLILTSISIFLYAGYIFYNNLVSNTDIQYISYIWMFSMALITLTAGKLSSYISQLQKNNAKLQDEYNDLVMVDATTGLGNIKSFYKSLDKEISRSKRYKETLTLMLIKFPYYKEIKNILGENSTNLLLKEIGNIITQSTRHEDDIYFISEDMIAIIMPETPASGANIVKERIKDEIDKLNLDMKQDKKRVNIDTKVCALEYSHHVENAIQFKQLCEEELQYDV